MLFILLLILTVESFNINRTPCQYTEIIKSDIEGICHNKICHPLGPMPMFYRYTSGHCDERESCDLFFVIENHGFCDENLNCYTNFGTGYDSVCHSDIDK
jgi:hypothetical protein